MSDASDNDLDLDALDAVSDVLHRYLTGLILGLVTELGEDRATDVVFGLFRRQHLERFLPGLTKLGLDAEPDAVACAKYHYLSNHVGGVGVAYIPESDTKAWVRYLPPRWIFDGTALAGVPTRVARAMLHGWHGHNGISLGNPRLGFVCTGQTMDGQPGLEGYYVEEDRELAPEERVRFRFGERCPPVDVAALPTLEADSWPEIRIKKAARNYSMDYIRNIVPVATEQLGPMVAQGLLYRTGRRIGMQYSSAVTDRLGTTEPTEVLGRLLAAQGDEVTIDAGEVWQHSWRMMRGLEDECVPEWTDGMRGLWEGVLQVASPGSRLDVGDRLDLGDAHTTWRVRRAARPAGF